MSRILSILIILMSSQAGLGQSYNKLVKSSLNTTRITISLGDSIASFNILNKEAKYKPNIDKRYHWYASNHIHSNVGGYSGKLLDKNYEVYSFNKKLLVQGKFKGGLKHGEWKRWHLNGNLEEIALWHKGNLTGTLTAFDENGQLLYKSSYRSGQIYKQVQYNTHSIIIKRYKRNGSFVVKERSRAKERKLKEKQKKYTIPNFIKKSNKGHDKNSN